MQDSGGLRVCYRLLSVAAHPEIPFPRVRGEVALAERGDLDIIAALDEGEQLEEEGRVALHLQRDRAVVLVLHPAGEAKALGGVPGAVAEAHALHLPFDGVPPPDGALGQGGGLAVLFVQKVKHGSLKLLIGAHQGGDELLFAADDAGQHPAAIFLRLLLEAAA